MERAIVSTAVLTRRCTNSPRGEQMCQEYARKARIARQHTPTARAAAELHRRCDFQSHGDVDRGLIDVHHGQRDDIGGACAVIVAFRSSRLATTEPSTAVMMSPTAMPTTLAGPSGSTCSTISSPCSPVTTVTPNQAEARGGLRGANIAPAFATLISSGPEPRWWSSHVSVGDCSVDSVAGVDQDLGSYPVLVVDPQLVPGARAGDCKRDDGEPVLGRELVDVVGSVAER